MKVWRITRIEAENFLSIQRMDLDLTTYEGITLVAGSRGPGRSNGAGKTVVVCEAPTWCLYGVTVKPLKSVEKIVNRHAEPGSTAVVRVSIEVVEDGVTTNVTIERTRTKTGTAVRISGLSGTQTKDGAQQVIDAWFGDYQTHMATRMFAGAVSSFCRLTDAARKELLEHMLGVGGFLAASDKAKAQLDALAPLGPRLAQAKQDALNALENARAEYQGAAYRNFGYAYRTACEAERLQKIAWSAHDAALSAREMIWVAHAEYDARVAVAQKEKEEAQASLDAKQEAADALQASVSEKTGKVSAARSRIREINQEIADIKDGEHPDICPTCGQRWATAKDPSAVAHMVEEKEKAVFRLRREIAPLEAEIRDGEADLSDLRVAIREARNRVNSIGSTLDERQLRSVYQNLALAERSLDSALAAHEAFLRENSEFPDGDEVEESREAVEAAKEAVEAAAEALSAHSATEEDLRFWRKGFSRTGIPAYLLDTSVPAMNRVLHEVATALTDGELSLRFNPLAQQGSKQVFAVEAEFSDGGDGFDAASHGEGTRIDIATLFAIRDLTESRSSSRCSQLFMDEIFDGVDEHFADRCVSLLRERYSDKQVFLISHDATIANLCDNTLTVKKVGKFSTVKQ